MKNDPDYQSPDVEDRRGQGGGGAGGGLIGLLLSILLRFRYGWIVVVLLVVGYVGARALGFIGGAEKSGTHASSSLPQGDTDAHFVAFVLDDAQTHWAEEFRAQRRGEYRHAKLVLFTDQTPTGCGYGDAATGPFYCAADEKVYIDLGFFRTLNNQLGAKGQFARAYVIAHEIGHHVQKLLGVSARGERGHVVGESGGSVKLELQADCYAGVWASSAGHRGLLDRGDIESALDAASRIGDDVLQREETGRVRPEKFTHGTAAQRFRWLKRGYDSGATTECDTFAAAAL